MTAIDAADSDVEGDQAFADSPAGIVTMRNVLPDWAVRLLVGTLLLPAFLTALDGFFRVRRRHLPVGPWLAWLGASALPVLLAWVWVRALGLAGGLEPPEAPVLPLPPFERSGWVALGSSALVFALGWFAVRPLILARAGERGSPVAGGLAARRARSCARSRRSCGRSTRTPRRCCCPPPTCGCSRPRRRRGCAAGPAPR